MSTFWIIYFAVAAIVAFVLVTIAVMEMGYGEGISPKFLLVSLVLIFCPILNIFTLVVMLTHYILHTLSRRAENRHWPD